MSGRSRTHLPRTLVHIVCFNSLFVERGECPQADIRDFLVVESNFLAHFAALRLDVCRRRGCRYSARKRQRQSGGSQSWGKFAPRRLLSVRHDTILRQLYDFRCEDVLRLVSHPRDIIADDA